MVYSSVAVANSFLFLHFNEEEHIEMNISRLNMLVFLTHCIHSIVIGAKTNNMIDELVIVGDYFPIYESIHRSFDNADYDCSIMNYGKVFDLYSQKYITPFINNEAKEYCFIRDIHKQFFDMENYLIEDLLTKEGSPYDLAYKNENLFIDTKLLNTDFFSHSSLPNKNI